MGKERKAGGPAGGHLWSAADFMTVLRMLLSLPLLFLPLPSLWFLGVYTLAGLTDVLDGWLARRSGTAGEFGARLDSAADLLFYGIALLRVLPRQFGILPGEVWYAAGAAVLLRLAAYFTAAVRYHRFAALHTWLNKLSGAAVFLLPYVFSRSPGVGYGWAVCALTFAASLEELAIHLLGRNYCPGRKSLFQAERVSGEGGGQGV